MKYAFMVLFIGFVLGLYSITFIDEDVHQKCYDSRGSEIIGLDCLGDSYTSTSIIMGCIALVIAFSSILISFIELKYEGAL